MAGGNKMTLKCHFMTTGENLLLSERMLMKRNEYYKLSDRSAVSEERAYKQEFFMVCR